MKSILILTTVSGFLNKFEKDNVKILLSLGYTVHYAANRNEQIYLYDESELEAMGVIFHHVDIAKSPYMLKDNLRAYRQLIALVKKYDIQAIHCHTPVGGVLGRLLGRHFKKKPLKVIYTAHGFHFYKGAPLLNNTVYYLMEKLMAPYTDVMILINQEDYDNACKFHLKKGGRVYRVPGVGLDLEKFSPLDEKRCHEQREALGLKDGDFLLVSVGELNKNKNQEIVLRALAKMRDMGKDLSHLKYGVCGDGFYREKMQRWIRELGLEDTVTMYGYCKEVKWILGCAQASVFPSIREGLGMAALESLAMGVPVLAADNRGTREYMKHGKNGYVCGAKDINGYIRGIEKLRSLNEAQMKKMKNYCKRSAEAFDKAKTHEMMQAIYERLDSEIIADEKSYQTSGSKRISG